MLEDKLYRWYQKKGKRLGIIFIILLSIYGIFKFNIIGLFAPFILAWFFATLLNPVVTWLKANIHLPRGIGTILSMLSILSGILSIIILIVRKLWEQVVNFTMILPMQTEQIMKELEKIEGKLGGILLPATGGLYDIDQVVGEVLGKMSEFLSSMIPSIYNAISAVPDIVLFVIAMLLSTFFMTKDYYKIKHFVKSQFSDTIVDRIVIMQHGMLDAIGGYIKTQLILMCMTFSICLVGLAIFNVEYALLFSVLIGIIDALPVFGSGTVLIPWAIYNFLIGNFSLCIGLLLIYGIIFVTRQIMEPKILSNQIGTYALITIMSVYIGYRTIGVLGMIMGPVIVVTVQMLQNVGAIPKFKSNDKNE